MAKKIYLNYYVHLTDEALVNQHNTTWPKGLNRAPYNPGPPPGGAAVEFSAPLQEETVAFSAPCLRSSWFTTDNDFPRNVASFSKTNWLIRIFTFGLFGSKKFYWIARFVFSPSNLGAPGTGEERTPIPARIWIEGFEHPEKGGGITNSSGGEYVSRDASRSIDGYGLAIRSFNNASVQMGPWSPTRAGTWERFKIRLRGTDSGELWRCHHSGGALTGFSIELTAANQIAVYRIDSGGNRTLVGAVQNLTLDKWYLFDIIVSMSTGGTLKVYLNHAQIISASASFGVGTHSYSTLGDTRALDNALDIDVDSWIGAEIPKDKDPGITAWITSTPYVVGNYVSSGGFVYRCISNHTSGPSNQPPNATYWAKQLESNDWANGSHVQNVRPTGTTGDHANWTGDWEQLAQRPARAGLQAMTSSTALANLGVTTDILTAAKQFENILGWAGFTVSLYSYRGTTSGKLGYKVGAAAKVLTTIVQAVSNEWNSVVYSLPGGTTEPEAVTTALELHHEKGNDGGAAGAAVLCAQVELIGIFGDEDRPIGSTAETVPEHVGPHNAPYPRSSWAKGGLAGPAPVILRAGTFVSTGAPLTLDFPAPVHLFWARRLSGDAGGGRWFSPMLGSHLAAETGARADQVLDAWYDLTFQATNEACRIRIGEDSQVNPAGAVTVAYLAIMDPGARFFMAGAFAHGTAADGGPYPHVAPLMKATWLAEFGFLLGEVMGTATTAAMYLKGPGHAADAVSLMTSGTPITDALTFQTGALQLGTTLFGANRKAQFPYFLFRREDGNLLAEAKNVMALGYWTGNGAASRTVTVAPGPNLRPLFAWVQSHGAVACEFRDPEHTGTQSSSMSGAVHSSGYIEAGTLDGFTVGASLNSNGVIYEYLIIWGSNTAGNGGWSIPGTYEPVPSIPPVDWPGPGGPGDPPSDDPPTEDDPTPEPEPVVLPEEPDFDPDNPLPGTDLFCVDFTQRLINLALLRIGVSKQIADIATSTTEEAYVARLHVKYDVQTTLRDFPWPFATKYATLVLVSGSQATPFNTDWTYAYRRPSDCVFERRIVIERGQGVNPTPPPFALSRDTGGGLILCNQANAVLEYTSRTVCPTYEGDDLFKDALMWRFAMSLAPPLTKMREKEDFARQMYDAAIRRAYEVLRPGNPGTRPASTYDPDETTVASNVAVINRALIRIGAQTIADNDEQSREALAARSVFEDELQSVLRDHPWAFATRYAEIRTATIAAWADATPYVVGNSVLSNGARYDCLSNHTSATATRPPNTTYWRLVPDLALLGGSEAAPINVDWIYAYRLPLDCVFARRLARAEVRRHFDPFPAMFRVGRDADGHVLYTEVDDRVLEYTARIQNTVASGDALFRDALAWRLAASLAPSLATKDPEAVEQLGRGADAGAPTDRHPAVKHSGRGARERMAAYAWAKYYETLDKARRADMAQQQQPPEGEDVDWIRGRL